MNELTAAHYGRRVETEAPRDPTPLPFLSLTKQREIRGEILASFLVKTKLRLYRNYSIKLMLAWEMCCRSDHRQPSPSPFPPLTVLWNVNFLTWLI